MVRIERLAPGHHGPQDACVLVGQRHDRLLPARAIPQRRCPGRDPVGSSVRRHHGRLGALDEQRSQVGVTALGDAAELALGCPTNVKAPEREALSRALKLRFDKHNGAQSYDAARGFRGFIRV